VYDKTVRRRRAVLGLLVACSLILLTAYFGETGGGVSRALKPIRDLFGWFGDTLAAKGQVEDLRAERDALRSDLAKEEGAGLENERLRRLVELDGALALKNYAPKTGRVIFQSPTVWYARIRVDKGSNDGVRRGHPVINEQALIGRVTEVFGGSSQVTLITDRASKVPARAGRRATFGIVEPASAGNPTDLVLSFADAAAKLSAGDRVVTRGTEPEDKRASLYPPGLPIGEVTRIDHQGTDTQEVHLRPYADMQSLDFVQILTRPGGSGT
jgi:rod shape-determining protein MreC